MWGGSIWTETSQLPFPSLDSHPIIWESVLLLSISVCFANVSQRNTCICTLMIYFRQHAYALCAGGVFRDAYLGHLLSEDFLNHVNLPPETGRKWLHRIQPTHQAPTVSSTAESPRLTCSLQFSFGGRFLKVSGSQTNTAGATTQGLARIVQPPPGQDGGTLESQWEESTGVSCNVSVSPLWHTGAP